MGVPGFNTWFTKRYPKAFVPVEGHSFMHVYLDLPAILHEVVRKANGNERIFHSLLHKRLDEVLRLTAPRVSVMLALDGPAPLAKLLTQRTRRQREAAAQGRRSLLSTSRPPRRRPTTSSSSSSISSVASSSATSSGDEARADATSSSSSLAGELVLPMEDDGPEEEAPPEPLPLSSLGLTPGTPLMMAVEDSIAFYICNRLQSHTYRRLLFELSPATVQGEGEIKILSRLARPYAVTPEEAAAARGEAAAAEGEAATAAEGEGGPADRQAHVIVGNDSDLILMALVSSSTCGDNSLYVLCDSLVDGLATGWRCFSVPLLEQQWRSRYAPRIAAAMGVASPSREQVTEIVRSLKLDLALVAVLSSGNDYLPGVRWQTLGTTWRRYLSLRSNPKWCNRQLVLHDGTIDGTGGGTRLDHLFLAELLSPPVPAYQGTATTATTATAPSAVASTPPPPAGQGMLHGSGTDTDDVTDDISDDEAGVADDVDEVEAESFLFPLDPLAGDCRDYLDGLRWNMAMYLTGRCPEYRWSYTGPSPCPSALAQHCREAAAAEAAAGAAPTPTLDNASASPPPPPLMAPSPPQADAMDQPLTMAPPMTSSSRLSPADARDQPLIPAAHAMALLPAGAREHAPSSMRHLMDPDSPVADLWATCDTCDSLRGVLRKLSASQKTTRTALAERAEAERAEAAGLPAPSPATYLGATSQLEQRSTHLRMQLRQLNSELEAHRQEAHAQPFPVERLEAAVVAVIQQGGQPGGAAMPRAEQRLMSFGKNSLFRYALPPPLVAAAASDGGSGPQAPPPQAAGFALPRPPVPSWKPLNPRVRLVCHAIEEDASGVRVLPPLERLPPPPPPRPATAVYSSSGQRGGGGGGGSSSRAGAPQQGRLVGRHRGGGRIGAGTGGRREPGGTWMRPSQAGEPAAAVQHQSSMSTQAGEGPTSPPPWKGRSNGSGGGGGGAGGPPPAPTAMMSSLQGWVRRQLPTAVPRTPASLALQANTRRRVSLPPAMMRNRWLNATAVGVLLPLCCMGQRW